MFNTNEIDNVFVEFEDGIEAFNVEVNNFLEIVMTTANELLDQQGFIMGSDVMDIFHDQCGFEQTEQRRYEKARRAAEAAYHQTFMKHYYNRGKEL